MKAEAHDPTTKSKRPLTAAGRDQALRRLRRLTAWSGAGALMAVGGLGYLAQASYAGHSTTTNSSSGVTSSAGTTTSRSASNSNGIAAANSASSSSSSPSITAGSSGSASVTSGGS